MTSVPTSTNVPSIGTFAAVLAALGAVHVPAEPLTQAAARLVTAAEWAQIAADTEAGRTGETMPATDAETGMSAELAAHLLLAYQRAHRAQITITALQQRLRDGGEAEPDDDPSEMSMAWDLATGAAAAANGLMQFFARMVTQSGRSDDHTAEALDVATALLVTLGGHAESFRVSVGLDHVPPDLADM